MSLKKFGKSDVIRNAMRAYPHNTFFIYSSSVYYDHRPIESGSFSDDILSASGGISLFEYNVDKSRHDNHKFQAHNRRTGTTMCSIANGNFGTNSPIIPYVVGRTLAANERPYIKASPRSRTLTEGPHRYIMKLLPLVPCKRYQMMYARGISLRKYIFYWLVLSYVCLDNKRIYAKCWQRLQNSSVASG